MAKVIGLDITAETVRVLQADVKKREIIIKDGIELPPPQLVNGEIENFEEILDNMLDNLGLSNGKKQNVNILFPSKTFQNQLIHIPVVDEKALKKSITTQMQQSFNMKEKNITNLTHCSDYALYGVVETPRSRQLSILMSLLSKDVALRCVELFNEKKFMVKTIESPVNNLFYVAETVRKKHEAVDVVIQILYYETNILFFQKGKPTFFRHLKFGGIQNFSKDQQGFFEKIFRTIEKYRHDYQGELNKIVLTGEVSNYFGISGSFREAFANSGMDVNVVDWTLQEGEVVETASFTIVNNTDTDFDSTYATTMGLLAREVL